MSAFEQKTFDFVPSYGAVIPPDGLPPSIFDIAPEVLCDLSLEFGDSTGASGSSTVLPHLIDEAGSPSDGDVTGNNDVGDDKLWKEELEVYARWLDESDDEDFYLPAETIRSQQQAVVTEEESGEESDDSDDEPIRCGSPTSSLTELTTDGSDEDGSVSDDSDDDDFKHCASPPLTLTEPTPEPTRGNSAATTPSVQTPPATEVETKGNGTSRCDGADAVDEQSQRLAETKLDEGTSDAPSIAIVKGSHPRGKKRQRIETETEEDEATATNAGSSTTTEADYDTICRLPPLHGTGSHCGKTIIWTTPDELKELKAHLRRHVREYRFHPDYIGYVPPADKVEEDTTLVPCGQCHNKNKDRAVQHRSLERHLYKDFKLDGGICGLCKKKRSRMSDKRHKCEEGEVPTKMKRAKCRRR